MHVRSPRPFSPRRRVDVHLFRHHAQQATSEKKRISTVSRRPRAYTANTQHRSVLLLLAILFVFADLEYDSPTYLARLPLTSRSYSHS
jgi:hypothetical protein